MSNADNDHIICPHCGAEIRIPSAGPKLTLTCPNCRAVVVPDLPEKPGSGRRLFLWGFVAVAALAAISWYLFFMNPSPGTESAFGNFSAPNWLSINYRGLVDQNSLAHGNATIGHAIYEGHVDASRWGLVQPCLEPFSSLCHDALLALNGPDTLPLVNVVTHYPPASAQPAWVALFREGDYQLYYNSELIRVFIEGARIRSSLEAHQPVLRHAVGAVIASPNTAIKRIEVYNFINDYDSLKILLNTTPAIFKPDEFDLGPRNRPLDLPSIHEFLKAGPLLEALEVDSSGNLFFYGRKSAREDIAGSPLSLADLAVVYRAIFHCNYNLPFVSLDPGSDSRYTAVNLGGHLENTRIGDVLFEADKCLKSLCSGIDPSTHKVITGRIRRQIPDFLSENERALLAEPLSDHFEARIWLYPDSVGVVTDKTIGVVENDRFLADLERLRQKVPVKHYAQAVVDHFNLNYPAYEKVFPYFKDVRKIARVAALFDWMRRLRLDTRISLDELLEVELPAYTTDSVIQRMVSVTALAGSNSARPTRESIMNDSRTYDLSNVVADAQPGKNKGSLLELAAATFRADKSRDLVPPQFQDMRIRLDSLDHAIADADKKLDSLDRKLQVSDKMLDPSDAVLLDRHNAMVDQFNRLRRERNSAFRSGDSLYAVMRNMRITPFLNISLGGGISLQPKDFKRAYLRESSPLITQIASLKGKFRTEGQVSESGDWVRSNPGEGRSIVHPLPSRRWLRSNSSGTATGYEYTSDGDSRLALEMAVDGSGWRVTTSVDGVADNVEFVASDHLLVVSHPGSNVAGSGYFFPNKTTIEFRP